MESLIQRVLQRWRTCTKSLNWRFVLIIPRSYDLSFRIHLVSITVRCYCLKTIKSNIWWSWFTDLVKGTETIPILFACGCMHLHVADPQHSVSIYVLFCWHPFLIDINPGGFPWVREGELQQADCRHRGPAKQSSPDCFKILPSQDLQERQVDPDGGDAAPSTLASNY